MTGQLQAHAMGTDLERLDGRAKVTGTAPYAFEYPLDNPTYLHPAETAEAARHAASLVQVHYDEQPPDVALSADRTDLYAPEQVNAGFATDTDTGDLDDALATAAVVLDQTYTTPTERNNPMEPHTKEFIEQAAVPARMMYAAPNRRTSHRTAALDVPIPSWMRAPGECPGMFGPEVAMDELAVACGLDPIELRVRNEPEIDPDTGKPWSERRLVACLQEGARRFGWADRDPQPRSRHEDGWLVGTGVSSSTYPLNVMPGSMAAIQYNAGRYAVRIGAVDIGTGAWTALSQIAADALNCPVEAIALEIGDTNLPMASVAGGSSGITCWGSAIVGAARAFRDEHGADPTDGAQSEAGMPENADPDNFAIHSFGAQFAEVRVHPDTGEIRVPRMLGVFSTGRIINPRTARSQFIGGMTMGLSMALHEQSFVDPRFGHVVNHDFAEYHIAANADVGDIEAVWLDEQDPHSDPMGSRGIGEIGIVGAAAAIANAAYHATGIRVRDLPLTADRFL